MHAAVETIRKIARHEAEQLGNARLGVVKSVHGSNGERDYACTVQLRESGMVLPKTPIATGLIGAAALPRENDLVIVIFLRGDLHAPVVIGRLYNEEVAPPAHGQGEAVISLPGDEESDDKRLELRVGTPGDGTRKVNLTLDLEGDAKVEIAIDDERIRLQTRDAKLELSQSGSSDGKAELTVADSKVLIEQNGDILIEAAGNLTLKAAQVKISGDTSVKVAGQTIDLN